MAGMGRTFLTRGEGSLECGLLQQGSLAALLALLGREEGKQAEEDVGWN